MKHQFDIYADAGEERFGIRALSGETTRCIFASREAARRVINLFEEASLSPIHMEDVLDDLWRDGKLSVV